MPAQESITLISGPLSLFTAKVRVALAEKEIAYLRIEVPFGRQYGYEPRHPDVLRHNPKAQIPVLIVQPFELVLWDSTVIIEYLEDRTPDDALRSRPRPHVARTGRLPCVASSHRRTPFHRRRTRRDRKRDGIPFRILNGGPPSPPELRARSAPHDLIRVIEVRTR